MPEVKWIKIVTDIFDDEKIKYIETMPNGNETIVIWFRILCLAGKSNSNGMLMMTDRIAYTDEMLSSIFNRDIKSIQLALNIFKELGMIEMIDNRIYLLNWERHQNAERLERIKEQNRSRVIKYRQKQLNNVTQDSVTDALQDHYSNATELELDLDLEKENNLPLINEQEAIETDIFKIIEKEFGRPLSSTEIDKIAYWLKTVGEAYFTHAVREALMYQKLSIAYIDKVLVTWQKKEYTLDQLNEGIQNERNSG